MPEPPKDEPTAYNKCKDPVCKCAADLEKAVANLAQKWSHPRANSAAADIKSAELSRRYAVKAKLPLANPN